MRAWFAGTVLCFLATVRVAADLLGLDELNAAAAVTNAAPAMKVFTAHDGYETYSSQFDLIVRYENGGTERLRLSPSVYSSLHGPYNRRNVYGALIAYGPVLVSDPRTRPMWEEMSRRAFCRASGVVEELTGNAARPSHATIEYVGQVQTAPKYARRLGVSCD